MGVQQHNSAKEPAPGVLPPPGVLPLDKLNLELLPVEPRAAENAFGVWDVFFWRETPDWYNKTFLSAGFMLSFAALRQYLDRHELEVFLPPRAKLLPESMRKGYRNREILRVALYKVGLQTCASAAVAGVYFGGAYYLGRFLGRHSWTDFTASGATAGASLALALIRPPRLRTTAFGSALGAALGSSSAYCVQALGYPLWDESRDFKGWWWGRWVDRKAAAAAAAAQPQQGTAKSGAAQPQQPP